MLSLSSKETGKIISTPADKKADILAKEGMMLADSYVKPGRGIVQSSFFLNIPIYSIVKNSGDVYIGTGSTPMIINVKTGDTIVMFEDGEIVYDMENAFDGSFYAAIQPSGVIVRILKSKTDTIYDFKGRSINFLQKTGGSVYAGVENELYKINGSKAEKIFEAQDKNITSIAEDGKNIIIGTEGKGKIIVLDSKYGSSVASFEGAEISFLCRKGGTYYAVVNRLSMPSGKSDANQSLLLKIKDGITDTILKSEDVILGAVEAEKGFYLYMSLSPSVLFYDYERIFTLGMIESDFIMRAKNLDGVVHFITAEPGRIYTVDFESAQQSFYSSVIDFGKSVVLNSVDVSSEESGKTFIRMGNTPDIDSAWTDFMIIKNETAEKFNEARYVQYKYIFKTSTDKLNNVSMYYKTINHAPEVKKIRIYTAGIVPEFALDDVSSRYPILKKKLYPEYAGENIYRTEENVVFIAWDAFDVDGDRLSYDVYLESQGERYFAGKNTQDAYVLLRTESFIDGNYNIVVEASDSADNTLNSRTGKLQSESIYIDNQSPKILEDKFELNYLYFTAVDLNSKINRAYISVNGSKYIEIEPTDEIFDSKLEYFKTEIKREKGEELSIVIFAVDQYGNIGKMRKVVK